MPTLLIILLALLLVLLVIILVASRKEDSYTVSRQLRIDSAPDAIYGLISDFRNWTKWSPWEQIDPKMKRDFGEPGKDPETGTGSKYRWKGNAKAGTGKMTILNAVPAQRVEIDLQFIKPFKSHATTTFDIAAPCADAPATADEAPMVTWTMVGDHSLPSKVMSLFTPMDKMIGPDFERGLAGLADALSDSPADPGDPPSLPEGPVIDPVI